MLSLARESAPAGNPRRSPRVAPGAGPRRSSRPFRPSSEGLEPRVQLSAQAVGAIAGPALVGNITKTPAAPKADIVLENLVVQGLGNNQYRVTATLRNGAPLVALPVSAHVVTPPVGGPTYPGGGVLRITRTGGGTILNGQPTGPVLAAGDPGQVIASMPIPALGFRQTVQLSVVTQGRAIFTATAAPAPGPLGTSNPLPDANPANNGRTVDNLVPHTYEVNTFSLGLVPTLGDAVRNTQIRLDSDDSHVTIPGVIDQHFSIPGKKVSIDLVLTSVSATYYVNNVVSTGVALGYEKGGLAVTVKFADNQHALHTPSSFFPDIAVTNLQVKVFLPLSYSASYQYFLVGAPKVVVTGDWHAGGPAGSVIDLLLPDLNKKVADALTGVIGSKRDVLSYQLTKPIHDVLAGGRIVSANVQTDQMTLRVETPA